MQTFFTIFLFVTLFIAGLAYTGIPRLMSAYSALDTRGFSSVGIFRFDRDRMVFGSWFIRVAASKEGLLLHPLFWFRRAFVPWSDVWFADATNPMRPVRRIGFLGCPNVSFFVTSLFEEKIERVIQCRIPA